MFSQCLRCVLAKDPAFKNSSSWPKLTEWCSSCTKTRFVKLVLPLEETMVIKEEMVFKEKVIKVEILEPNTGEMKSFDASTQTPPRKSRRTGGQGSRTKRMLAYQLMLTERFGLPLSRLHRLKKTSGRFPRVKKEMKHDVMEEKVDDVQKNAEVNSNRKEASAGGTTLFTPRSFQSDALSPPSQPFPQPTSPFSTPCFPSPTSSLPLFTHPQCGQMPWPQWVQCGACQVWGTVLPCYVFS